MNQRAIYPVKGRTRSKVIARTHTHTHTHTHTLDRLLYLDH